MDKFKTELTWHNCKTHPPKEDYNPLLIYTNGRDVDYCTYHKKFGFPVDANILHKFWWADLYRAVQESSEFKELCK